MRFVDILTMYRAVTPPVVFTPLSSLLSSMTPGAPFTNSINLLVDVQMQDSDHIGLITNTGTVMFDPTKNTRLLCDGFSNASGGKLLIGTDTVRYPMKAVIDLCGGMPTTSGNPGGGPLIRGLTHTVNTPTGNNGTTNDFSGVYRGLINAAGCQLKLYGANTPYVTRLNAHYASGTSIVVETPVTAKAGATVMVTPSNFFDAARRTEVRTLAVDAVNATTLTLNTALGYARWGVKQWFTDNGPSLTQDAFTALRTDAGQDPLIDERAFVIIHDQNIIIRGYDRAGGPQDWLNNGFGMHQMSMGLTSTTVMKNVGLENYGQSGLLARYGIHFHIPSYDPTTGAFKTDGTPGVAPGNIIKNANYIAGRALIQGVTGMVGQNRFIDLHGCRGVKVTQCIGYQSMGHMYFEEDGSEEDNEVSFNLAIDARQPMAGRMLKQHDSNPAGFWFANPNNLHQENYGIDCQNLAWWNAHSYGKLSTDTTFDQRGCFGLSSLVGIQPFWGKMGTWTGNSAFCCGGGTLSNNGPADDEGNLQGNAKFHATTDGLVPTVTNPDGSWSTETPIVFDKIRVFKSGGYVNVVFDPRYTYPVMADVWSGRAGDAGNGFSGVTLFGAIQKPIFLRESLNHESHALHANNVVCHGFTSYHGTLAAEQVSAYGFAGSEFAMTGGGNQAWEKTCLEASWESYIQPVLDFPVRNFGWKVKASDGFWQTPPSHLTEIVTTYDWLTGTAAGGSKYMDPTVPGLAGISRRWTLGVIFDAWGDLGSGPTTNGQSNSHIVFLQPYFTYGVTEGFTALENNPESGWTTRPYVGFVLDQPAGAPGDYVNDAHMTAHLYQRTDSSGNLIAGAIWSMPSFIQQRLNFHHGVCPVRGYTRLTFPAHGPWSTDVVGTFYCAGQGPSWYQNLHVNPFLDVNNDWTVWAISFSGSVVGHPWTFSTTNMMTSVASLAALNAATPNHYWQDTANNLMYIKMPIMWTGYQFGIKTS